MKFFWTILLIIGTAQITYSQVPFDVYCNNVKITNNNYTGYFCPQEFKFKFSPNDTLYKIKSGFIVYTFSNEEQKKYPVDSNYVLSDIQIVGKTVEVEINKIEKWKSGELVDTDTALYKYSINCTHTPELSNKEIYSINNNHIEFQAGGKKVDPVKGFDFKKGSVKWEIKGGEDTIDRWEILLVRGNRPVAQINYTNTKVDIGFVTQNIKKGDFFRVKIHLIEMKTSKEKILYKIIRIV
jgi:hypothetical protein